MICLQDDDDGHGDEDTESEEAEEGSDVEMGSAASGDDDTSDG